MLSHMTRSWLGRTLTSLLGLVFAASMSISSVQATEMAARMAISSTMGIAAERGKCPDCDHGSRDMKTMDCRVAVCGAPAVATLASKLVIGFRTDGLGLSVLAQSSLASWAHPPDPYPPKLNALG